MKQLNHPVFWPPFILLATALILSLVLPDVFKEQVEGINNWILQHFDGAFTWGTFFFLILVIVTYFSPFAKQRIGGAEAVPLLKKWQLFSITLCTTIATGILFWGCAEPLYHVHSPPEGLAASVAAKDFALSTLFMHWSFTPYAIYCLLGIVFAWLYYQKKQAFSIGIVLQPLFKKGTPLLASNITDIICLFALVAGMAASLGAGILTISGGLNALFHLKETVLLQGAITTVIVLAFVLSAASGLLKGIKWLSLVNTWAFIALALFVLFLGPVREILSSSLAGLNDYFSTFIERSTGTAGIAPEWNHSWTTFYWANWLAWAPITAMFLGKIARGYTIRQFIQFNFLLPSLFGIAWMSIFAGATLHFDRLNNGAFYETMNLEGIQTAVYSLFQQYPASTMVSAVFLLVVFISFITAADSNTTALSGMSTKDSVNGEGSLWIKIVWGLIIGTMAFVMITFSGIDGARLLSVLGGFPVLFFNARCIYRIDQTYFWQKRSSCEYLRLF